MTAPTPLARLIADQIRINGPMGIDRYMALALGHPALGYYATRDPFGRAGDFTTAPEISQMFGEMLGLWAAAVWQGMGAPAHLALVELGPGRGTLMSDALRAARAEPAFRSAVEVHFVETSPVLSAVQRETLGAAGITAHWHGSIETLPDTPTIVLANEFFDALPIKQYGRGPAGWHERLVGLDEAGRFAFGLAPEIDLRVGLDAPPGTILEVGAEGQVMAGRLARHLKAQGGAALIIDYGHARSGFGETFQALRRHGYADPLDAPGEADLTAHVDFAALARAMTAGGAATHGPVEQGRFLRTLGIEARAARLGAARPDQLEAIAAALARLTEPGDAAHPGMGRLFKVLAAAAPGLPDPPGFEQG